MDNCTPTRQTRDGSTYAPPVDGIDPRFLRHAGREPYTGNELLVKGALEAGCALITGYPGSPVSDVFDTVASIAPYLAERGVVAQIANNEGLAAARLNGARQAGLRAMAVMKSVGMHVAADALATGNLMEARRPEGGALIVVGDDPWNETTQINSDSRYLSRHLHMPVLMPATFQEMKDWIAAGFELSGRSDLYVTFLVTTNLADGGAAVDVRPHPSLTVSSRKRATLAGDSIRISDAVMIPPHTSMREATLEERHRRFIDHVRELGLNKRIGPTKDNLAVGFVTSGLSSCFLEDVLRLFGLWKRLPVLKLGVAYPLDEEAVLDLASRVQHLVIVEEKRGFIEEQIVDLLVRLHQAGRLSRIPAVWGKNFPDDLPGIPVVKGLNVSVLLEILGPAFLRWRSYFPSLDVERIKSELQEIESTKIAASPVPKRLPTFCPGCPHRDSAVASRAVKTRLGKEAAGRPKTDLLFHGESGCHSMLQFAPNEGLMQNYSGMGLGGGTGAGMSPFISNKQVVFLGDSTFFHSGLVAISDSLKNDQDITYIILQNDTTAMTGHQPTPGNDVDVMGRHTDEQNIEKLLRGMFPRGLTLRTVNPADRSAYEALLEETVQKPGVKVLIAQKECAITLHRRLRRDKKRTIREKGFLAREEKINITPEVCEYCLECTRQTACPGLTVEETIHGRKIATDRSTCVDDGACARTKACPSFERIVITRSRPPASGRSDLPDTGLAAPEPLVFEDTWTSYTAGVGGMGAGVVNAILVRAGVEAGYKVNFLDKKGLAIRNGGVYGHVTFAKTRSPSSPVIPYGKASLLIGLDLLESARAVDGSLNLRIALPERTRAVLNTHKNETVLSLMGTEDFDPKEIETGIRRRTRDDAFVARDFSELAERFVGSKLYANVAILGAAFQSGALPLTERQFKNAIEACVPASERGANLRAFKVGRIAAVFPERLAPPELRATFRDAVAEKAALLREARPVFGRLSARAYLGLMEQVHRWIDLPADTHVFLATAVYDLIRYEDINYAKLYISLVWETYRKDGANFDFRVTKTVVRQLYRTMAIKDEVWVAELLTSPEKYRRDAERFGVDPKRGDRMHYVHLNRPRFTVLGKDVEFDIETKDWMLRLMRHAKFLRRWLPDWHRRERDFRDWYAGLVRRFRFYENAASYDRYVEALKTAENVRGYREIRYRQMEEARSRAEAILGGETDGGRLAAPAGHPLPTPTRK